ncbi:MAG TPA: hypothetical protein VD962_04215 [Rubricoccaceae bacterium]|nr:hypothetical protein [Rubricoccaceae bacterium]
MTTPRDPFPDRSLQPDAGLPAYRCSVLLALSGAVLLHVAAFGSIKAVRAWTEDERRIIPDPFSTLCTCCWIPSTPAGLVVVVPGSAEEAGAGTALDTVLVTVMSRDW